MAKMTKAEMEAWKKKNFDRSKKVTEAQLDKLRKEGTPTKAIAKYKNDPSMREALNRFYGKARVEKAAGSSSITSSGVRGGPGAKMPKRPSGGPGPKMTARDGRGGAKSSTAKPTSNKPGSPKKPASTMIPGRNLNRMTPAQRKQMDQLARVGKDVILPMSLMAVPGGSLVKGGMIAKGAKAAGMSNAKKQAASNIAKRSTWKAKDAMAKQKAATAAKNAVKTGKGSGAGSASRAKAAQAKANAAKAAAQKAAEQARNANARTRSLGTPKPIKPKSAKPKGTASSASAPKQANEVLMNMKDLAKNKKVRRTGYAVGIGAYLARPRKDEK